MFLVYKILLQVRHRKWLELFWKNSVIFSLGKKKIQVLKKPAIEIHTLKMFKESQIQIQSYYILYMPVSLYVAIVKTMLFHNMNTETSK